MFLEQKIFLPKFDLIYFYLPVMLIEEILYSRHFLVIADTKKFPKKAYECALEYAKGFEKDISFLILLKSSEYSDYEGIDGFWKNKIEQEQQETNINLSYYVVEGNVTNIPDLTQRTETPMVFFEITKKGRYRNPMFLFKNLRELRIPFIFTKEEYSESINFSKILVPVGFLNEEKEKGPYSSNMGRFLKSEIVILQANDYGSKTPKNVQSIEDLYHKFDLVCSVMKAKSDSFGVEKEAAVLAEKINAGMIIVSTSRDYGLDDIFFGPKELHTFKIAKVPVMFINPRPDLYVLCW